MKMTKATKWVLWGISFFILFVIVITAVSINLKEVFGVKNANFDRKIYEESKSYYHGMIQDLAKFYKEYQNSDAEGREVIKNIIQMNFANFNSDYIDNDKIKTFFIEMRGY